MSGYSASNHGDVRALASRIQSLKGSARIAFAAFVSHAGLIHPQLWLRLSFAIVRLRKDSFRRFMFIYHRFPAAADEVVDGTSAHILRGKDREDADSVGGFSQREVDMVAGLLDAMAA